VSREAAERKGIAILAMIFCRRQWISLREPWCVALLRDGADGRSCVADEPS
jgi:hypothetical protein